MSLPFWNRLQAFFGSARLAAQDSPISTQPSIQRLVDGGRLITVSTGSAILNQANIQIHRMSRYRDYEQMDQVGELSLALDLYADETTVTDPETGHVMSVKAGTRKLKDAIEDFLYNVLDIDKRLRPWVRYLCKYGDMPMEIIPTANRNGIARMRLMDVYNFIRVESKWGDLIGYFYHDRIKVGDPIFLHPFQVMHARLEHDGGGIDASGLSAFGFYGRSVLEGSRKAYKQVRLMEDAALVYRLCLRGDSRVWTPDGYKYIKDVEVGDEVYSYSPDGLEKTKVTYSRCNGKDKVYRVRSTHREIYANATHPVLIERSFQKGGQWHSVREYVDVKDLRVAVLGKNRQYVHRLVMPVVYDHLKPCIVPLWVPEGRMMASVSADKVGGFSVSGATGRRWQVPYYQIRNFLVGKEVPQHSALAICEANGFDGSELEIRRGYGTRAKSITFPAHVTADLARLWGFWLGDGWVNRADVAFALGDKEEINEKYRVLFRNVFGVDLEWAPMFGDRQFGCYRAYSTDLADYMRSNGFINGVRNKRLPQWAFQVKQSIQEALMEGFADADGHWSSLKDGTPFMRWHLCNEGLLEDVKELAHQMGWNAGLISHRHKGPSTICGKETPGSDGFNLIVTKCKAQETENILSVEEVGDDDVYDIGVESPYHNFVVNGVTVHNTRAPERRIFTIPVGNLPVQQVQGFIADIQRSLRKEKFFDTASGELNERWDPLIMNDDIFLPQRTDGVGPKIDTLAGAMNLGQVADLEFFKKKMMAGVKIPLSRVGLADSGEAETKPLSQSSPEFSKSIQWIQREMTTSIKKVVMIHLALMGYNEDQLRDFDLRMTASSALDELYRMEVWQTRADVIDSLMATGLFPPRWVLERFTDLTEDEIEEMEEERRLNAEMGMEMQGGGGGGGGPGGLTTPPAMGPGPGGPPEMGGPPGGMPGGPDMSEPGLPEEEEPLGLEQFDAGLARRVLVERRLQALSETRRVLRAMDSRYNGYDAMLNANEFDGLSINESHEDKVIVESPIDVNEIEDAKGLAKEVLLEDLGMLADADEEDEDTQITIDDLPTT